MRAHRADIDGLRAVAVIPVVLYHAGTAALPGGFLGVDVFFVISGFLITSIIRDEIGTGSFSLLGFYERRARRILPALFFMIGACFLAGWIILLPDELEGFAKSVVATTVFASNMWFWREGGGGYFDEASEFLPMLHTWSLAVEEQFYLLFPVVLAMLSTRRRATIAIVVAVGAFASLALAIFAVGRWSSAAFYLAPARAWELGVGAMIALGAAPQLKSRWSREIVGAIGLTTILLAVFLSSEGITSMFDGEVRPSLHVPVALAPCLGAAAVIIAGASGPTFAGTLLSMRPIRFIGLISYSLYLWHWPILSFLRLRLQTVDLPWTMSTAAVAAAVGISAISWALVERPFRNRAFLKRPTLFALAGGAMAASIVGALVLVATAGFPSRISPEAIALAGARNDINPRREECFWRTPSQGLCGLGIQDEGPVDFLFWGDSHADALFPGVDEAARISGRRGLFAGASRCPPLIGIDTVRSLPPCGSFNDAVFQLLRGRRDISTVILYARWSSYHPVDGNILLLEEENPGHQTASADISYFSTPLRRTIEAITATGRRVIIIEGTPEPGWMVPQRLYTHARWGDPLPSSPTMQQVVMRNARVNGAMARISSEERGVRVVSLLPVLCARECPVEIGGRPLYFDDNHLSTFAAEGLLVPLLVRDVFSSE